MFPAGETVTLLAPGTATDRYSDTTEDWTTPTRVDVPGCAFAPQRSVEITADGDRVVIDATVYLPSGTSVTPQHRVEARGKVYTIEGEPGDWRNPYTGWEAGIELTLKRVEG